MACRHGGDRGVRPYWRCPVVGLVLVGEHSPALVAGDYQADAELIDLSGTVALRARASGSRARHTCFPCRWCSSPNVGS